MQAAWRFKPRRQEPGSRKVVMLLRYRMANPILPPGAHRYKTLPRAPIAWRTRSSRQALYQQRTSCCFRTSIRLSLTFLTPPR